MDEYKCSLYIFANVMQHDCRIFSVLNVSKFVVKFTKIAQVFKINYVNCVRFSLALVVL